MTASNCGIIAKRHLDTHPRCLVISLLYKSKYQLNTPAINYGKEKEGEGIKRLE